MRALDTNVVLRLMIGDDPTQHGIALKLITAPALVTVSVLIESGWVLRSRYGFDRLLIVTLFETLFEYATIVIEAEERVRWALRRYAQGGDLADLLHIAGAGTASTFATFDRAIAQAAGSDSPVAVETLG